MANSISTPERELGLAGVLATAWPGVRINRIELGLDTRSPDSNGGELFSDQLSVSLSLSAEQPVLIQHGLLVPKELQDLPPCGVRHFGPRTRVFAQKRITRLECFWTDPEDDDRPRATAQQRVIDRMAEAIAAHALSTLRG